MKIDKKTFALWATLAVTLMICFIAAVLCVSAITTGTEGGAPATPVAGAALDAGEGLAESAGSSELAAGAANPVGIYRASAESREGAGLPPRNAWAAINLAIALLSVLLAMFALLMVISKKAGGGFFEISAPWGGLCAFGGVTVAIVFRLTQDLHSIMKMADEYTNVLALIFIVQLVVLRRSINGAYRRVSVEKTDLGGDASPSWR
ncbi:MAG: hypothetical protein LBG71_05390 [Clostridiales Family XIII bacterium]|nr:hypothetical protein [Clostridiales Family XIII bacterium]